MAIKIVKASDLKQNMALNILIYGAPGSGKTTFAATADKPLIIDLEKGVLSIADFDVDIVQCENLKEAKEAIEYALDNDYKTVVIDSLTRYSELLLEDILNERKREKAQIQDWGDVVSRIKKLIWELQNRNINTIFICLETESSDEENIIRRPNLPGQLKQAIPAIVDIVGYLQVKANGERVLCVNPTSKYYAKDRSGKLGGFIKPDFQEIKKKIFNSALDPQLVKAVQSYATLSGFDYKTYIKENYNKSSSKELTKQEAMDVIEQCKAKIANDNGWDLKDILNKNYNEIKEMLKEVANA